MTSCVALFLGNNMRLEKVIIDGFKSFADRTEFVFSQPITAIVGPNGCGKSNVVDAVKWVLGEQKVKSLRSEQMTDVIFNGSTSRKPLNAAEVTLVLANPPIGNARSLPIETDAVEITRKVYRSGESEYRINGKVCRLKDIRELMMGTGLGTKAYSIIEQGQIEQIVTASTVDRRQIFEEAAGISKYKWHKKEAMRRLDHTEQNLLRLADILGEVTKRLRSVKTQAARARTYLELNTRLKELQISYALADYAKHQQQIDQRRTELADANDLLAKVSAELARIELAVSQLNHTILQKEHTLNQIGNQLVATTSKTEHYLQKIDLLHSHQQELEQTRSARLQQIHSYQQQVTAHQQDLGRAQAELAQLNQQIEAVQSVCTSQQDQLRQTEAQIAALDAELADEKAGIIDIVRRTAQLHNEIRSLCDLRENLAKQRQRLQDRAQVAVDQLQQVLTEKAQNKARFEDIQKVLAYLQQSLDAKRLQAEQIARTIEQANTALAQAKEQRSAIAGQLEVLRQMEERFEGLNCQVRSILQERASGQTGLSCVLGIVAQVIETDMEYAPAVEAALEGLADALVVTDTTSLMAQLAGLDLHNRVKFLLSDGFRPWSDQLDLSGSEGVLGRLVEFVRYRPEHAMLVWGLVGKTILVDDLQSGLRLAEVIDDGYRIVTRQGQVIEPGRALTIGPIGKAEGLISRKSLMRQLEAQMAGIDSQIEQLQTTIACDQQTQAHLLKVCKDLRTSIYEAHTERVQIESRLAALEQTIARLQQEQPLIAGEIDILQAQIGESVQREYDSKQRLMELEAVNTQRNARIEELQARLKELQQHRQASLSDLTEQRVRLGQLVEQARSTRQMINGLQEQLNTALQALAGAQVEITNADQQIRQAESGILEAEAAVSQLFLQKDQLQHQAEQLKEQIQQLAGQHQDAQRQLAQLSQQKAKIEQTISDIRLELAQLEVRQQDLVARVREDLQMDLVQAYQGYADQAVDWQQVQAEIAQIKARLERLGAVNLEAMDEQKELETRCEFLTRQLEDLQSSKAQLQDLIVRLNEECRQRFTQTFEQIRENFQQVFRKLFGGGRADIILEQAEDDLEAGVEVMARPPGKETRSISLLSGGEKSMTALALLFAVFRTRPSPFCFLDEVDAALDEANNERFNLLVKEFQADSQFVIITHSKRTMSMADELIGITMQVQGVSKKISVRFEEYEAQAAVA